MYTILLFQFKKKTITNEQAGNCNEMSIYSKDGPPTYNNAKAILYLKFRILIFSWASNMWFDILLQC